MVKQNKLEIVCQRIANDFREEGVEVSPKILEAIAGDAVANNHNLVGAEQDVGLEIVFDEIVTRFRSYLEKRDDS